MRIVVSSAGRFHAVFLAQFLAHKKTLAQFFSAGTATSIDRRKFLPQELTFNWPINIADRVYVKFRLDRLVRPTTWYVWRDGLFDAWVKRKIAVCWPIDLFVGWANCSLKTMQFLKPRGVKTIIESGSMHILAQEAILQSEYARWGVKFAPIVEQNRQKMLDEYALADRICVPSKHVAASFVKHGIAAKKIIQVPYGIDYKTFGFVKKQYTKKFKVIFVGQISLQKGILYLLQAWQQLNLPESEAELVLVGNVGAECKELIQQHFGKLAGVNFYGPVKHTMVADLLSTANLFVMPSLQEGLAMVIGEAMATGTAVLASHMSGALEFIKDGQNGFIVPAGNTDALAERILYCFHNQELTKNIGRVAKQSAIRWQWRDYAAKLFTEYQKIVGPDKTVTNHGRTA